MEAAGHRARRSDRVGFPASNNTLSRPGRGECLNQLSKLGLRSWSLIGRFFRKSRVSDMQIITDRDFPNDHLTNHANSSSMKMALSLPQYFV